MKIEQAFWFTEVMDYCSIGIVLGVDEITGERKAYIGKANERSEVYDASHIASYGAKFTKETALEIMEFLDGKRCFEREELR